MLWVRISIRARCTTLCDKVYQWLATGRGFSPDPPVSPTNKTDRHDIAEVLLKVALNTIKQANKLIEWSSYLLVVNYTLYVVWLVMSQCCFCFCFWFCFLFLFLFVWVLFVVFVIIIWRYTLVYREKNKKNWAKYMMYFKTYSNCSISIYLPISEPSHNFGYYVPFHVWLMYNLKETINK